MLSADERQELIEQLRAFPHQLAEKVGHMDAETLNAKPIAGEWSIRQNVHHLVDSHMNAFIRLKLILTEDVPRLKRYNQDAWADLADVEHTPVSVSLMILRGIHERWAHVFEHMQNSDWSRNGTFDTGSFLSAEQILSGYVKHGNDHLEQIQRNVDALRS